MLTEISLFTVLSTVILFSFISGGIIRFGLQPSYSVYSKKWSDAVPINSTNLWSIITIVAAFLLCPAMLEVAAGSALQFLGLLTPVYLIITALIPDWYTSKKVYLVHAISALLCMCGSLVWLIAIMHAFKVVVIIGIFYMTIALLTGTTRTSMVFWFEMWLLVSVYVSVLLLLF